MVHINRLIAAKKFGPGYFIREQMEFRSWTQEDLAEVMGITIKHLNKILRDKQPVTLEMAKILGEVFNISAQYWINLDTDFRLWLKQDKTKKEKDAEIRAAIYERMPIQDMVKKGWLKKSESVEELTDQVILFWKWKKLNFYWLDKNILPFLTRKSKVLNQFNASYAATWYQMARNVAENYSAPAYNKTALGKLYDHLYTFTTSTEGIADFLIELKKTGVIFFVLPHLQKTYLDGAAFLKGKTPVIVFTGRYKRIDNFWFTIAHEIAHVLRHLSKHTPFVLDNLKDCERNEMEDEANAISAEKLKHTEIEKYLSPYLHYLTAAKVEECAANYQIHPSIIIGKLAHDKKISYRNIHLFNNNVLEYIPEEFNFFNIR